MMAEAKLSSSGAVIVKIGTALFILNKSEAAALKSDLAAALGGGSGSLYGDGGFLAGASKGLAAIGPKLIGFAKEAA